MLLNMNGESSSDFCTVKSCRCRTALVPNEGVSAIGGLDNWAGLEFKGHCIFNWL